MSNILNSIVQILYKDENSYKNQGIGFVVETSKNDDYSYILTCNHVVYDSKKNSKYTNLKVDNIEIQDRDIILGLDQKYKADIALIKILNFSKVSISIEDNIEDEDFMLKTFKDVNNDKHSSHSDSIELTLKDKDTVLRYDYDNSNAYTFSSKKEIKSGYSGSPIINKEQKVVAILNISEDTTIAKALSINNIYKVFPKCFKKPIRIKKTNLVRIYFEKTKNSHSYNVRINDNELTVISFINDEAFKRKKEKIVDSIFQQLKTGYKRVELFLPAELFDKDIHLWCSSNNRQLNQESIVIYRSLEKSKYVEENEAWREKWQKNYEYCENKEFKASIIKNRHIGKLTDIKPITISAIFSNKPKSECINILDEHLVSIAIWINKYKDYKDYKKFLKRIKKINFCTFQQSFYEEILYTENCATNSCLMWDDPTTLPLKDFNNE